MTATLRVTSKNLGFIIALSVRYEVGFKRIPRKHWWEIRKRYEVHIPIAEGIDSSEDYWARFETIAIAMKKGCYQYQAIVFDDKRFEKVI